MSKNIILFGATGSIGTSVLRILDKTNDEFLLKGITCDKKIDRLIDISNRYKCDNLGISNEGLSNHKNENLLKKNTVYGIENFDSFINEDIDILIGNEDEFESLLDSNIQKTKITENFNLDIAVITKGSEGADFIRQNELIEVDGTKVDSVIDTTGAGDMFAAGFIFKYINGHDPKESVEFANKLASLIIQKFGARADSEMLNKII